MFIWIRLCLKKKNNNDIKQIIDENILVNLVKSKIVNSYKVYLVLWVYVIKYFMIGLVLYVVCFGMN